MRITSTFLSIIFLLSLRIHFQISQLGLSKITRWLDLPAILTDPIQKLSFPTLVTGRQRFSRYQTQFWQVSWRVLTSKLDFNKPADLDCLKIFLVGSHRDPTRSCQDPTRSRHSQPVFGHICQISTRSDEFWPDPTLIEAWPCSNKDPSEPTQPFDWSATSLQIVHRPTRTDPWSPLITTQKSSAIWLPCKSISPSTYTKLLSIVPICKWAFQILISAAL